MTDVLIAVAFPVIASIIGGTIAAYRPPGPKLTSAVQHFVAGVVFAAVASEIIPDMLEGAHVVMLIIGFSLGVIVMLGLGVWERRAERVEESSSSPKAVYALLAVVGADLLIDGMLIGIGFVRGSKQGQLLTIALSLELLFLGLAVVATLAKAGATKLRMVMTSFTLGLLVPIAAILTFVFLGGLTGGALVFVLSAGSAALLYLITEELLVQAHEVEDTPLLSAMFFLGFIAILVIELFN